MTTLDERLALSLHEERFRAVLASVFGVAALVLAAVGLYSLTARQVFERRQEIGIRAALGARPRHVRALMLRDGLIALGMGLAIGMPAAYAAAHSARALLFGVAPTSLDPHRGRSPGPDRAACVTHPGESGEPYRSECRAPGVVHTELVQVFRASRRIPHPGGILRCRRRKRRITMAECAPGLSGSNLASITK